MSRCPPLKGLEFLRRYHCALHHCSLQQLLRTLAAGGYMSRFTEEDVRQFMHEGCGLCDSAKMQRRSFKQKLTDSTVHPAGKSWVLDTITLQIASAEFLFKYITRFMCM